MRNIRRLVGLASLAVMLGAIYFVAYGAVIPCGAAVCVGTNANDAITEAQGGATTIFGLGGNDTISTGDGNGGADIIRAGGGNDVITLTVGAAALTALGESGNDLISAPGLALAAGSFLDGGPGNDTILITTGPGGEITILDGAGADAITDTTGALRAGTLIVLTGDSTRDVVSLAAGNPSGVLIVLSQNSGRDVIDCGGATLFLNGNSRAVDPFGNNLRQAALLGGTALSNCALIIP